MDLLQRIPRPIHRSCNRPRHSSGVAPLPRWRRSPATRPDICSRSPGASRCGTADLVPHWTRSAAFRCIPVRSLRHTWPGMWVLPSVSSVPTERVGLRQARGRPPDQAREAATWSAIESLRFRRNTEDEWRFTFCVRRGRHRTLPIVSRPTVRSKPRKVEHRRYDLLRSWSTRSSLLIATAMPRRTVILSGRSPTPNRALQMTWHSGSRSKSVNLLDHPGGLSDGRRLCLAAERPVCRMAEGRQS